MFQRFASVLFGDDMEEVSRRGPGEQGFGQKEEEEEDEEWILVDYLAEACSSPHGDGRSGVDVTPEEEEEEEDLVVVPSPIASPVRYASSTSLNSTADTDQDGGPEEDEEEEDEEEEEEEGGFLRLEACSMEESWFVTPPPCFTGGRGSRPLLLETSPLENLLIEHPSMSVYMSSPPRLSLNLNLSLPPASPNAAAAATLGKEAGRRSPDAPRHRPEVAVGQRRASLHSGCYAAALCARAGLLDPAQQHGRLAQRVRDAAQRQPLSSRNALRRLNLLPRHTGGAKQAKTTAAYLHQPGQRHLNY